LSAALHCFGGSRNRRRAASSEGVFDAGVNARKSEFDNAPYSLFAVDFNLPTHRFEESLADN